MKELTNKQFTDWFAEHFGFGYGNGELYIIPALLRFLSACPTTVNFDFEVLEKLLTPTVAWLLINELCKARVLEYGTSPRFGWLDMRGVLLKSFMTGKTVEELYELVMVDGDYLHCSPTVCNCGPKGYEEGKKCDNPLF